MLTYEFRTIETFVKYLDDEAFQRRANSVDKAFTPQGRKAFAAEAATYERIANIVRMSNLGIVIPAGDLAK